MATKKKRNSLVENINRRKRSGTSRSKSRSTVSKESYDQMQRGWPQKKTRKKSSGAKKKKVEKNRQPRSKSRR